MPPDAKPEKIVVVLHETLAQSICRDLFSAAVLLAVVGVGVWVGSSALQWIGGLLWVVWLLSHARAKENGCFRGTPDGAVAYIRSLQGKPDAA